MKRIFVTLVALVLFIPVCSGYAEDLSIRISAIEAQLQSIQAELNAIKEDIKKEGSDVLTIQATAELSKLLDIWDGKYAIFINKNTDIKTLEDLNGRSIYCDMYTFGMETAVSDMSAFIAATGINMEIGLGNNIPQFLNLMSEDKNMIGFLPKSVADSNSIQGNTEFLTVLFE